VKTEKPKFYEYEYWPVWLFYAPFVPYWFLKSIQSASFSYFCRVNPGMRFGGFLDYSKYDILKQIPQEFLPETQFISHKNQLRTALTFPFIAKPDWGERGVNVELIQSEEEWRNYPLNENLIIQQYIDLPLEFGIFYVNLEGKPQILSITGKEFMVFHSDGKTSIREFVLSNPRISSRAAYFSEKFKNEWNSVFPEGKQLVLEHIGNHNRGTRFFDASHLITERLTLKISEISKSIKGFNYGRFDVKTASEEDLKQGKFIVLEVNGANSEPTHIYDESYTLRQAYGEVKRHFDYQYQIARKQTKTYSTISFYQAILKRIIHKKR
jgi:hypothetical protein